MFPAVAVIASRPPSVTGCHAALHAGAFFVLLELPFSPVLCEGKKVFDGG